MSESEFPLIVSYFTKDTFYQLEVQNLIASCEKWGLCHHIEPIASQGSWEKNCCFKPIYLLEKLQQFKKPIFWVDADAVFVKRPQWRGGFDADLAIRINETLEDKHCSKVNTGSIFVNATLGAVDLLKCWGQECYDSLINTEKRLEVWDQIALRDVILRKASSVKIDNLPLEYMAIVDDFGNHKDDAVIVHYQASRRFKNIINGLC